MVRKNELFCFLACWEQWKECIIVSSLEKMWETE